jgi:O-antigen/teichoic acid export membrane protein
VGLFVGVYVARYLGPEQLGVLSFAMSFVALFGAFGRLGLDGIVVRNVVKNPETRDELLGTAFGLRIIGGLTLIGTVFFSIQFTDIEPRTKLLVMIIASGHLLQAFEVIDFYFQSQVLARLISFAGIVSLLFSSAIKLCLIWFEASLVWFAWIVVVEQGVKGIILCVAYIAQHISLWQWRLSLSQAKKLLRDSWPLILSGLAIMVYMRIDQVMIKMMLNNEAVGIYSVAVNLSEAWYFIPMAISSSVFPAIINSKKQSDILYYQRLQKLYDMMVWLALAIALPTTFLSPWVIRVLYGDEFLQASGALSIHIWAGVFVFLGVASGKWLLTENLIKISFYRTFLGAAGNFILNLILIPIFHLNGAAIATLLANFLADYLFDFTNFKTRQTFLMKTRSLFFWGTKFRWSL